MKNRIGIDIGGTNTKLAVLMPEQAPIMAIFPSGRDPVRSPERSR